MNTSIAQALQNILGQIAANKDKIILAATASVVGVQKQRIFNQGKADDGSDIGNYSRKPARFSQKSFAVKAAFNPKPGQKTQAFDDGYEGLRASQGFQTEYVDLQYSGSLFTSYQYQANADGTVSVGFTNPMDYQKARGNEKHFKKEVFKFSLAEVALLTAEIQFLINQSLSQK